MGNVVSTGEETPQIDDDWQKYYKELKEFKIRHGDCDVRPAKAYRTNNPKRKFAEWVDCQRINYKRMRDCKPSNLTPEQMGHLEKIGFERQLTTEWEKGFELLVQFKKLHGHCNVPLQVKIGQNSELKKWVMEQRCIYERMRDGKSSQMTRVLLDRLESIGFEWVSNGTGEQKDEALIEFENQLIPESELKCSHRVITELKHEFTENFNKSTISCDKQKIEDETCEQKDDQFIELENQFIPESKVQQTENSLQYVLTEPHDELTLNSSKSLALSNKQNSDALIEFENQCTPESKVQKTENSLLFVSTQLQDKSMDSSEVSIKSSDESKLATDDLKVDLPTTSKNITNGYQNTPKDFLGGKWQRFYEELVEFEKEHGHCNVTLTYKPDKRLKNWVYCQIKSYADMRKGKYSPQMNSARAQCLKKIGFERDLAKKWEERYNELVEFKKEYGHCNPSTSECKILKTWAMDQRQIYKRTKQGKSSWFTKTRIKLLENIGFEWTTEKTWKQRYDDLAEFKKQHGHCNVFPKERALRSWVDTQKIQYRKMKRGQTSTMTQERVEYLAKLGFECALPKRSSRIEEQNTEKRSQDLSAEFKNKLIDDQNLSNTINDKSKVVLDEIKVEILPKEPSITKERKWKQSSEEIVEFEKEHEHYIIPSKNVPNKGLEMCMMNEKKSCRLAKKSHPFNNLERRGIPRGKKVKRGRGRPRKKLDEDEDEDEEYKTNTRINVEQSLPKRILRARKKLIETYLVPGEVKRGRGRPRKYPKEEANPNKSFVEIAERKTNLKVIDRSKTKSLSKLLRLDASIPLIEIMEDKAKRKTNTGINIAIDKPKHIAFKNQQEHLENLPKIHPKNEIHLFKPKPCIKRPTENTNTSLNNLIPEMPDRETYTKEIYPNEMKSISERPRLDASIPLNEIVDDKAKSKTNLGKNMVRDERTSVHLDIERTPDSKAAEL